MKKKKTLIIISTAIILIAALIFLLTNKNTNRITLSEKNWLNSNSKKINDIYVKSDLNNFSSMGNGVFFEFINDFSKEMDLTINPITISKISESNGVSLLKGNKIKKTDQILYEDHYVLVGLKYLDYLSINDITSKKIGVLNSNKDYISQKLNNEKIELVSYKAEEDLINAIIGEDNTAKENTIDFIIVPLNEYIDSIIEKDLVISHHFSDIKNYYYLRLGNDKTFNSIVKKYFNTWKDKNFANYYNEFSLQLFLNKLEIDSKDERLLTSKVYNYGFISNSPYEIIKSGNYSGIVSTYLKKFSDFSNIEFKYIKFKNYDKLMSAIDNGDIDIYFDYYNESSNFTKLTSNYNIEYSIIAPEKNYITMESTSSLNGKEVYVLKDSILEKYLQKLGNVKIKTYKNENELFKLNSKDTIIFIDKQIFNYYKKDKLYNYTERAISLLSETYAFRLNGDATLYKLMDKYFTTLDPNEIKNIGIYNHNKTLKSGTLLTKIARVLLYILIAIILIVIFVYQKSKKITLQKRTKKDDKIKYIDVLTSLKNRNYLNDNISSWDNNTIYPQTIIVIGLDELKVINDTFGHQEGDKQIQAAANILIKTQLDNTDIIRSDGNEFIVYMVGYTEKQVASYKRKLYKEFKNLPYDKGVNMGHSMINDDLKLIDDAINEATLEMHKNKDEAGE